MAFKNYLEDENDKPYFTTNSLAYYYDKMEGFAEKVEGSAKALNLTKEEVEKRLTLYIQQNKNELDQRLAQWDGKIETLDSTVETLLTEWVDDGTLTHVIDSTLIDQRIAPVAALLADKVTKGDGNINDFDEESRAIFLGLESGQVNAVLGEGNVTPNNLVPYLKDSLFLPLTNRIKNGNFSNGIANWSPSGMTFAVANNELTMTVTILTAYARAVQAGMSLLASHKYYFSFSINPKYNNPVGVRLASKNAQITPVPNTWNKFSAIDSPSIDNDQLWVFVNTATNYVEGDTVKLKNVLAIDLTEMYGAGNEPTKEQMDALLLNYPDSWFEGTVNRFNVKGISKELAENKREIVEVNHRIDNLIIPEVEEDEMTEGIVIHNGTYWEDITFVNGEVWGFSQSDVMETGINQLNIFNPDFTHKKQLRHNFGHCNSIDYNPNTDALIFGNGGQSYDTDGFIHIIQNAKQMGGFPTDTLLDLPNGIPNTVTTSIGFGKAFGSKINAVWGDDNLGRFNTCFVMSNDNQNIRKLLLGRGVNQLESGTFTAGRSTEQYNGTYKIINTWTLPAMDNNQGSCFYNGFIYCAIGHSGLWSVKYELKSAGTVGVTERRLDFYNENGTLNAITSSGIDIKDGWIYHGYRGGGSKLYRYPLY